MHEIKDGLVYRWSDYWDMQKFVGQFPAWFLEEMMKSTAADFTDWTTYVGTPVSLPLKSKNMQLNDSEGRLISLAAGVVQEFPPEDVVYAAAGAGFNATGIWCDLTSWNSARNDRVKTALKETGLCALDLEVMWLKPGEALSTHDAMIEIALDLGVRNVLCVSSEPDIAHTKKRFEYLCRKAEAGTLRVVLEFLAFTEVRSLRQALEVVQDVSHPCGGILVDTLHLQRTGASALDVSTVNPTLMPYIQLCDASAEPQDSSPDGLLEDALYLRQLPGEGELPLKEILAQLDPQLPLSLEIRSRALLEKYPDDPFARASQVFEVTQRFLQTAAAKRP
jgi:sugar phosphate isomerase/epimerase